MRSPADGLSRQGSGTRGARWRVPLEWALRIAAIILIALEGWRAIRPSTAPTSAALEGDALPARLAMLSRDPSLERLQVRLDSTPDPWIRDWLSAFARTGTEVWWDGRVAPVAITAEPVAAPGGGVRLAVAASPGARVALHDDASPLDSVQVTGAGAAVELASVAGEGVATVAGQRARVAMRDSVRLGAVVIFGRPAWETRFTITALEEAGWRVSSRVAVAPGAVVSTATQPPLDTGSVSAVVVLDSTAAPFARDIARYVRSGGGLVLHARAATNRELAAIAPARAGAPIATPVSDTVSLATLGGRALVSLPGSALPIATQGRAVIAAVQRVRQGRVLMLGLDESWRWRLGGGDDAVASHRAWWSSLVSAAAHAPVLRGSSAPPRLADGSSAPLASLVAALGPSAPSAAAAPASGADPRRALLTPLLILLLLLATWWSRRLRGAP